MRADSTTRTIYHEGTNDTKAMSQAPLEMQNEAQENVAYPLMPQEVKEVIATR